ncbi:helicase-associated domain-containing protein [Actinomyces timonensis]|uniref:Helicase-associated domain-containing protein n=1 Tax=Actinomyces timonensis TaxID=1288391 RepID=A0AAU8N192_9ACTO
MSSEEARRRAASAPVPATVEDLAARLTGLADREIAALLLARPDLLSPPSPSFTALAARAAGRTSTDLALAQLDAAAIAVAEGLVGPVPGQAGPAGAASADDLAAILADRLSLPLETVASRLSELSRLALTISNRPAPGLAEALAPVAASWPPPTEALTGPSPDSLAIIEPRTVAAESAQRAEEAVRLVTALLREWSREPGPLLRTGGVGVRPLARTAEALALAPAQAATVIEIAAAADLLGLDDDGAAWLPAAPAMAWLAHDDAPPLPERWAALAAAWASSARTPWLVGSRGEDGALRAVLGDAAEAPWARSLRHRVLRLLAVLPDGASATPGFVRATLTAARPRRAIPEGAITAILAEAELLGITGAGALSRAGRALAERESLGADADPASLGALEDALAADLPEPVPMLLVQSDLTAIVPGRPVAPLAALLERSAVVESRGGALALRFTPDSVRGALDAGLSAAELLDALGAYSPAPLPGALEALVEDAARRHGAIRVRPIASILRVPDPATAAGLLAESRLAGLGLNEAAPGIITATASAGQVLRELRATGLAPVMEDGQGRLVIDGGPGGADGARGRGAAPEPTRPGRVIASRRRAPASRELAVMVGRMRAGQEALAAAGPAVAASDPVHALAVLRQGQANRSLLRLRLAGPDGEVQEREVRVRAVEPGRVRLADVARETELTVAVHRIVSVAPVSRD